ncbi:MAG: EAL domain-containing protein [Lachnospiraceae bacterium]|nr:EAL domain-containing protein [Lachnospiraceae bacterium]
MWDYSFEIPNLMILGIVLLFFYSRPRLALRRNIAFIWMVLIETWTIITDVLATCFDNNATAYPMQLLGFVNMLYFVAFFLRSYVMYLFAVSVMKDTLESNPVIRQIVSAPFYVGVGLSIYSSIVGNSQGKLFLFYVDRLGYHSGSLYCYLYICGFYYVVMAYVAMFLFWKNFRRRREKYGMILYNLIICASYVTRIVLPKHLIMDTFVLMAILVVFLAFENPEFYLDLRGSAFNRLAFSEQIEENAGRYTQIPLGIVVHDFHEMRDIYGSSQIEEGLAAISKYLKQIFKRATVFYCRNGRFIVLAQPGTDLEEKSGIIANRFKHPWKSNDMELYLTVGFAVYDDEYEVVDPEIILTTMLKFLDAVGKTGRVRPVHATKENLLQTIKEKEIRGHIERAIENNSLELFLQPIVDAKTEKVVGAEALSRIRDDRGDIILPGDFIPVAESSGRINELGEIIFEKTCIFIKENGLRNLGIEWINVNLSPSQFIRTNLSERYAAIAEKHEIDPSFVHLEITESSMIDDGFFMRQIDAMSQKGFKFVLDDYGTGYSNLARLKKCPLINIKIDMTIVWDYCKEKDDLLPTMVKAFKQIGFTITAEGIENTEMVDAMKDIGCNLLQGFHYSRAIPCEEFAKRYGKK